MKLGTRSTRPVRIVGGPLQQRCLNNDETQFSQSIAVEHIGSVACHIRISTLRAVAICVTTNYEFDATSVRPKEMIKPKPSFTSA